MLSCRALRQWPNGEAVNALLGLCRRYGGERVNDACKTANAADMSDIHRLERMLKRACPDLAPTSRGKVMPLAKYLRPTSQYALPFAGRERERPNPEGETP